MKRTPKDAERHEKYLELKEAMKDIKKSRKEKADFIREMRQKGGRNYYRTLAEGIAEDDKRRENDDGWVFPDLGWGNVLFTIWFAVIFATSPVVPQSNLMIVAGAGLGFVLSYVVKFAVANMVWGRR